MHNRRWVQVGILLALLFGTGALPSSARAQSIGIHAYVNPDGSLNIIGDPGMAPMMAKLDELVMKTHPESKFRLSMKGSSTGIAGLTAGISALGPMAREAWPVEIEPFKRLYGYPPTDIHIGRVGYRGAGRKNPPGLYVHADNPLPSLSVDQIIRIFSTGNGKGDITRWEQLGVQGKWASRTIHLYGPRDDGSFGSTLRASIMEDQPFPPHYEALSTYGEVIEAVGDDPFGIGLVSDFDANLLPKRVRTVALAKVTGGIASTAEKNEVQRGLYPLSEYLHLYVNRSPGVALDPFVAEYVRVALSQEGQAIIASYTQTKEGYFPLSDSEITGEFAKLN